ncbi:MAG: hypothetical protein IT324_03510 [Anaerolineae bacterium]|nr:hypothetical protein [Anaerolineae bacterium]
MTFNSPHRSLSQTITPLALFVGFGLILAAVFIASPQTTIYEMIPTRTGQAERCITCHNGIEPISVSHPTAEFGCVSCHGGERLATTKDEAHANMVRNPASLDTANQYCGECHAAQVALVPRTLMSTYAGAIGLVRRTYGLQPDNQAQVAIKPVGELQAFAVQPNDPRPLHQFADNCLSCHLHAEPTQADYLYRSTGCASCHVLYNNDGLYQGNDPAVPKDKPGYPARHEITTAIPYTQCNHCHNQGNYDLRTMTFLKRTDRPVPVGLSAEQSRAHDYYQPIGKFTRCEFELDCVDCHTTQQVMGDGVLHNNRSETRFMECQSCHGTQDKLPTEMTIQDESDPAIRLSRLNPRVDDLKVGATILTTQRGEQLWHVHQENGQWILTSKATGITYTVPLVKGSQCQQKPDQQESHYCHECHAYNRVDVNAMIAQKATP